MPGWHAKTTQHVRDGKLFVAGIAPEQHGERMALFLQWKEIEDMPVMIDSFNVLGLKAVPITLLIDEAGVVRHRNPSAKDLDAFLKHPPAEVGSAPKASRPVPALVGVTPKEPVPWRADLQDLATFLIDPNGPNPARAEAHFQLGVAFRKRFDSKLREPTDFTSAVEQWTTALKLDPSNYIWRRRLQQYGPLLDKPYPFYNWIGQARKDITARGDTPHPLVTEPGEAELAVPSSRPSTTGKLPPHPDPAGRLPVAGPLIGLNTTVVAHTKKPASAVRVFLDAIPDKELQAKWNDEAGVSTVHIKPPKGWTAHPTAIILPPNAQDPLHASRRIEFELRRNRNTSPDSLSLTATVEVFSQVCSGIDNICQFLRSEVQISLRPSVP